MNPFGSHLLDVVAYLPLLGAVLCLLLPKDNPGLVAKTATGVAALDLSRVARPLVVLPDLPALEDECRRWKP